MSTIAEQLTDLVAAAAEAAGHADAPVPLEPCVPTGDPKHGDYQSNFAFRLGKALRTNPRAVAQAIADAMPDDPRVASWEVAGPGFLNARLSDAWLAEEAARRGDDPTANGPTSWTKRKVVVDYSSPNIAKRMHIGHIRSTLIGHALVQMYRFLGDEVIGDNHIGDWGTPFGKLMVAWHAWRDDDAFETDAVGELQRLYQLFGAKAADDPTLEDQARAWTARLQAGDAEATALWRSFKEASLREFDGVYDRLGISFDWVMGESDYEPFLDAAVAACFDAGIAEEDGGATIVRFSAEDGKGLKDKVLVLRKSDGAATYGLTDVATVQYRVEHGVDAAVYVTDIRQKQHFQQIFAIAKKLGIDLQLEHVGFGMLRFPDGGVISSRKRKDAGESSTIRQSIDLVDVLDEAVRRARVVVDAHAEDVPDEDERADIAEAVGLGALRYADLSQNPQSDVLFDWDKMLALQGNTAPYLMYAHARCRSVLRKAGDVAPGAIVLGAPEERDLAIRICQLPEIVAAAAGSARPNLLADHLYGLASAFSSFWTACPVLRDDVDADTRASRLALVAATAATLKTGLGLLGIRALDRM